MKSLVLTDKIYGRVKIATPVITELIKSKPFQRLKYISQLGVPQKFYYRENFSRYEHSLGVFILLQSLGASLEEQVAGLLHDISHTTFSHVFDWMVDNQHRDDSHEKRHLSIIKSAEISSVLEKYGYVPTRIADLKRYKLLDRHIPALCADRIDYSLRQFPQLSVAKSCYKDLTILNKVIAFKSKQMAATFGYSFLNLQISDWSGYENISRYQIFAQVLKKAIQSKVISKEDFHTKDERYIIKRLEMSHDRFISHRLSVLRHKSLTNLPKSRQLLTNKFRYVDPPFISQNNLTRLTEAEPKFRELIKHAKSLNKKGIYPPDIL